MSLVVTLLPEERLSHSVIGWLSASLSFIVPSAWADWDTSIDTNSLELDSANFGELVTSLLTGLSGGLASVAAVVNSGGLLGWLDAMVEVLFISFWALHSTVATSNTLEKIVTLSLVSGWGDFFTVALSVGTFASGLSWGKVQFASGDLGLDRTWEIVILGEEGLDVVGGSDSGSVDSEDASQAGEFLIWHGKSTGNNKCENNNFHVVSL
jgi:hypothetical protein